MKAQSTLGAIHPMSACIPGANEACLTMIKSVDNTGGGTAQPSDWTLVAEGHHFSGPDPNEPFSSGQTKAVEATQGDDNAHYDLSESDGPDNYSQESLVCTGDGGHLDQFDRLTLDDTAHVTCTFTNKYVPPQPATIIVNAGGVRTGDSTVGNLPDGAVFQAVPDTDDTVPGGPWTCTISGGTCDITVPGDHYRWTVSEKTAPAGWYVNPTLGTGGSGSSPHDYVFETTSHLDEGESYTVTTDGDYGSGSEGWNDDHGQSFGSKLATSIDDPTPTQKCGINIALVLDQSGSMEGTKQSNLKKAANGIVDGLTGTPSRLAMYTFGSNADNQGHIGLTSTATTQSAQDLHDFVNGLPTDLDDATNWDRGLGQIIDEAQNHDFDLVIFLTDGAPTVFGSDAGYGDSTTFRYVDEGVYSANAIKATGTPLIGVGVGLPTGAEVNLRAVSGQTKGVNYYTETSSSFVQTLVNLASGACKKSLTIQKQIEDPSGHVIDNSPDANGWTFTSTITGGTLGDFPATKDVNENNGFTSADLSIPAGGTAHISLTEDLSSGGSGYSFVGATCTADGNKIDVSVSGTTASFDASAGQAISCVFTNKQPEPAHTVTVNKVWENAIAGDTTTLTLGDKSGTSTATGGNSTDNNVVSAQYTAGQTVKLSETLGADVKGFYYPIRYSCDNGKSSKETNLSFTMPDKDVTCTVTNPNENNTVHLGKWWTTGIAGDTATVSINGATSGPGVATSTSNGEFDWKDKDHIASLSVPVGSTVTIGETLGADNKGSYTHGATCTGPQPNPDGTFQMPPGPGDVTCWITNFDHTATVTLQKAWAGSIAGDTTTLSINGGDGLTLTSKGGTYTENKVFSKDGILVGSTVKLAEKLGADNAGDYTKTLTCDNGVKPDNGSFTMPDAHVTCTYTNTAKTATVTLQKAWVDGVSGDTANLVINSDAPVTSTSNGQSGSWTDPDNKATKTVATGSQVTVAEALGVNKGRYTDSLTCKDADGTIDVNDSGQFTMPGSDVTCTFTNTNATAKVTLQKTWVDGVAEDTAVLNINGSDSPVTSTSNGQPGTWTDTQNTITETVPVGSTVQLSEEFGAGNHGSYTSTLTCDNGVDPTGDNTITMIDAHVTCTWTNTAAQATIVLLKNWVNSIDGDTTELTVNGGHSYTSTTPGGDFDDPTGTSATVSVGSFVNVRETLGTDNAGVYGQALTCTDGTNTWTDDSFRMPAADASCTYTNTADTGTVTLKKYWQDPVDGDTAGLQINGTTLATSTAKGTGIDDTNVAHATVPLGSDFTIGEVLGTDNLGSYTTTSYCTVGGKHVGGTHFTMPTSGNVNVDCVIANTGTQEPIILQKTWVNGVAGDSTLLQINGATTPPQAATSTSNGDSGSWTDKDHWAVATVNAGTTVTVAETLGGGNTGVYDQALSCTDGTDTWTDASFTMPDEAVTCTFTNTAERHTVTLQKTWVNGVAGDTANLVIDKDNPVTSTSNGQSGSWTDPDNKAAKGVSTGASVTVAEALGNNEGRYTAALSCTDGTNTWTDASFVMPAGDVTCTFTNTLETATLTLEKNVVNEHGGTAKPTDWTLSADGPTPISGAMGDPAVTQATVRIGTYTLGEDGPAGYKLTDLTCTGATVTDKTITLADGDDVTCAFTNTDEQASLTLVKKVDNADGWGTAKPGDWDLSADGPTAVDAVKTGTTTEVLPGSYTLSEDGPSGYDWSKLVCTTAGGAIIDGVDVDHPTVPVALGDDVTCTLTNTAIQPTLTLVKKVDNGDTGGTAKPTDWTLSANGPTIIDGVATGTTSKAKAGEYTLTESDQLPGYTTTDIWSCVGGSGMPHPDSVTVKAGDVVTCTITNTAEQPTLTLVKKVDNGDTGGTAKPTDWTLSADGPTPIDGVATGTTTDVKVGSYTLSEDGPSGYQWTKLVCETAGGAIIDGVDADNPTVPIQLGDDVTCTLTNTAQPAHLTLKKTVHNDHGGTAKPGDWTLNAGTVLSGPSGVTGVVKAGTYPLTETGGPDGYTLTDLTCSNAQGHVSSVTIGVGENVTCTFTNTDVPASLTLVKQVDNGTSGATHVATDWDLSADGPTPVTDVKTGTTTSVDAGRYTLSESGPDGYTASDWTCGDFEVKNGTVDVPLGADVTCTITNTAETPTLTLTKTVHNEHGGSAGPGDWTLTADGPSTISGTSGSGAVTKAPVKIGSYTLGEFGLAGYDWSKLVCETAGGAIIEGVDADNPQLTLALGDDVTCVFTNTDLPAQLTLQKIVDANGTNSGKVPADWTLTATPQNIDGQGTVSGNGDPDSTGGVKDVSVFAGTYKLSESGPAGFDAGDWVCPGAVVDGDLVTIPNGGSVLCQITNTAEFPHLTLIKNVENGDTGGTATDQDWTLTADGSASGGSRISGKTGDETITNAPVKVGTYRLSESAGPVGYTAGDWICTGDGTQDGATVALAAGQSATCMITNTAQPGTWSVSKTSVPASGSTVRPGDTITYTITSTHTGGVIPANTTITDDLSQVLDNASLVGTPDASNGTATVDGTTLSWDTGAFEGTATVRYTVKVAADAWGVTLKNAVTPPKGGTCVGDTDCTTDHYTPHWDLSKTSDPASGSVVPVGSTVTYTLHAVNDSKADVAGAIATDDVSDVLDDATLDLPLPVGLTIAPDGKHLVWAVPDMPAGSPEQTVSYSVTVNSDAFGQHLVNAATPDDSGSCPPVDSDASCTTDNRVQDVDLKMVKSDDLDGAPVDSGSNDEIGYTLHVSNVSEDGDPATDVTVSDPLPDGLTIKAGSIVAPAGWDTSASTDTKLVATFPGPLGVDAPVDITFTAVVGDLSRSGPDVPYPSIQNTACVTEHEHDADPANNCSTDTTPVKSIAVTAHAVCSNNAPLVTYEVTPYNVSKNPTIALIWWTKDGYAHRDPSIPASDKAALLANGAKQVDYVTVPAGWKNGDPVSGKQLWPGTTLDADGNPISWPGWTKQADGSWVLDPNAPGYDLRGSAVVEVRINPSTAVTEIYPPATPDCNPNPPKTIPSGLPNTGSDVATTGMLGAAGLLILLGILTMFLVWRRHRKDGTPE